MNKLDLEKDQGMQDARSRQGIWVLSLWLASVAIAGTCSAPLAADWMHQVPNAPALILLNWSFSILLMVGGVFFAIRDWDWSVELSTSKWVWAAAAIGLLTLIVSNLSSAPKLVPVGFLLLLGAFLASQKSRADGSWLFRFAFFVVPFVALLSAWTARCFQVMADVAGSGIGGTLTWFRVPVSVVESSLLLETHTVELATLPLAGALQVTMLMTVFWVAVKRRSPLALPAYMLAGILWCFSIVTAQGFMLVWKAELGSVQLCLGTATAYAITALMILSTDRALRVLLFEIPSDVEGGKANPLLVAWNKCFHAMTFNKSSGSAAVR
ncbi:MAG: hypothetical protein AB8B50_02100 [Pirellulaceae bacterium]